VLEFVTDLDAQREFGADAVFTWWEDWFYPEHIDTYAPPLYAPEERQALIDFHKVWERACEQTPARLPAIEEAQGWPIWQELRNAAEEVLTVFEKRGKFSEDEVAWSAGLSELP
jgi:hypothetical protein